MRLVVEQAWQMLALLVAEGNRPERLQGRQLVARLCDRYGGTLSDFFREEPAGEVVIDREGRLPPRPPLETMTHDQSADGSSG